MRCSRKTNDKALGLRHNHQGDFTPATLSESGNLQPDLQDDLSNLF
ncbi:hypothetical protein EZMO1_1565 [Endozoicomonas montiporae CL-33]|uniref:Uncharacterized protein n=1 Tax=Endozoicomonas montiporae CL-33 TaxID=570277 RepID=A0A142BAF3_9GAMM|nr:hypothetical protein EZMO1_1565 [Endozoicomonas montiporae CL-33]